MPRKHDKHYKPEGIKQASTIIVVCSLTGLTICFVVAIFQKVQVPIFLYAIFGGGVLGTDNIIKLIKSVFRTK